jgi:hypothetical protein
MASFSVLVGCYGAYPQYSLRAVGSVLEQCQQRERFELLVGCNEVASETAAQVQDWYASGLIDALVLSRANRNKDPMMRVLIEMAQTPWILWLDDDSHLLEGWDEHLEAFLSASEAFDAAGHVFYMHKWPEYAGFLRQRPWFDGEESFLEPSHREKTWFATGGLFLARTAFLRRHNFPDRGMVKRFDDLLLGDLVSQQHGRLVQFPPELMDRIRISDGDRRGSGEGSDGWRDVNPVTGF